MQLLGSARLFFLCVRVKIVVSYRSYFNHLRQTVIKSKFHTNHSNLKCFNDKYVSSSYVEVTFSINQVLRSVGFCTNKACKVKLKWLDKRTRNFTQKFHNKFCTNNVYFFLKKKVEPREDNSLQHDYEISSKNGVYSMPLKLYVQDGHILSQNQNYFNIYTNKH